MGAGEAVLGGTGRMVAGAAGDDRSLARRLAADDPRALEEIWALHGPALARYVRHFVSDPSLAEEVLQDTLVAAWRGAARFGGRSSLRTWLCGIARRQALGALRRRARTDGRASGAVDPDSLPAAGPMPQDAMEVADDRASLASALRRLSPLHREVLLLTFVQGLAYEEQAEALRVPVGTVKSRIFNAKRALRAVLEEGCSGPGSQWAAPPGGT